MTECSCSALIQTMRQHAGVGLAMLALSCGKTSAQTHDPQISAPDGTDPTVLLQIDEQVGVIRVDDQRIYWTGGQGLDTLGAAALRSCAKEDCAHTVVTYDASGTDPTPGFGLENGQIYWFHYNGDHPGASWTVRGCSVAGCGTTAPTVITTVMTNLPSAVAFTQDSLFITTYPGVYRFPLAEGGDPDLVVSGVNAVGALLAQGDYLYWFDQKQDSARSSTLRRARSDGSDSPQTLADDLEVDWYPNYYQPQYPSGGLAFDATSVYWSQGAIRGSIVRCPLDGCSGAPEVVAAPVRSPTTLQLDGENLYFQHDTSSRGLAVSSCALGACELGDPIATGLDAINALAIDDQYFYTATTDQTIPSDAVWSDPTAQIRRFPK